VGAGENINVKMPAEVQHVVVSRLLVG